VAVEDERATVASAFQPAHEAQRRVTLDLVGAVGVGFHRVEVDLPQVHIEASLGHELRHGFLGRGLLAVRSVDAHQPLYGRHECIAIERGDDS
jgi:hypothetical protein